MNISHTIPQFDPTQAFREGWGLYDADQSGILQIQVSDDSRKFESDSEAFDRVLQKAAEGSPYHREALELVWFSERADGRGQPHDTPLGRVIRALNMAFEEDPPAFRALLLQGVPCAGELTRWPYELGALGDARPEHPLNPLSLVSYVLRSLGIQPELAACYADGELSHFGAYRAAVDPAADGDWFSDWQDEVAADATRLGYVEWCDNRRAAASFAKGRGALENQIPATDGPAQA